MIGSVLGTVFELHDNDGNVIARAGTQYHCQTYYANQHRELTFWVNSSTHHDSTYEPLGNPFPAQVVKTRVLPHKGKLMAINYPWLWPIPHHKEQSTEAPLIAEYDEATKQWVEPSAPNSISVWGWQDVCAGTITYQAQAILFDGTVIFDGSAFAHTYAHFADGKFLIWGMSNGTAARNSIMLGTWACDASETVQITHLFAGVAPQPHRNWPYTWLYAGADTFLVGTNLGFLLEVSPAGVRIVIEHQPGRSWQPYALLRYFDNDVLIGPSTF